MKRFSLSTKIYSGEHSLTMLSRFKGKKIWIVCDEFLVKNNAIDLLQSQLTENHVEIYTDIQADPSITTIVTGMKALIAFRPDIVIGFGGGSAIDAAKAMVFFSAHFDVKLECCIAIPTTSGTGSEVTNVSVITDEQMGVKFPLVNASISPDFAILDPLLVTTVPPHITANTGMDVLTHAIEAYVSNQANDFSDAFAEKAIQLVFQYLPTACAKGHCIKTREKMHNASTLAGMAFNQSGLGINHAIAHQLGGQFHIPHGLANALLLTHVIRFNAKHDIKARKRYARLAKMCRFCHPTASPEMAVNQLIHHIQRLQKEIKINTSLRALSLTRKDIVTAMDAMVNATLKDITMKTTPYSANRTQIRQLIEALL